MNFRLNLFTPSVHSSYTKAIIVPNAYNMNMKCFNSFKITSQTLQKKSATSFPTRTHFCVGFEMETVTLLSILLSVCS